jgi:ABC-type multidrug transport system ATPase subunit
VVNERFCVDVAIRTEGLTKAYGSFLALDNLDLEIRGGEVFGYIGPNGSGKSTTIRLLLDLLRPTKGRAEVLGMDVRRQGVAVRRRLGYLAGELALYEELAGRQALRDLARLRGGVDQASVARLGEQRRPDLNAQPHDTAVEADERRRRAVADQAQILQREIAVAPAHRAKRRLSVKHGSCPIHG